MILNRKEFYLGYRVDSLTHSITAVHVRESGFGTHKDILKVYNIPFHFGHYCIYGTKGYLYHTIDGNARMVFESKSEAEQWCEANPLSTF